MFLTLFAVFVATVGIIWWLQHNKSPTGYKRIPGPLGVPFLGNVLQVGNKMHLKFVTWANKYGDIYQIQLGNRKAIVLSDPNTIKEMFTGDPAFAGRAFFEGFEMYPYEPLGIVSVEGELWEVHRRFMLRQLRDFGFGKSSMEQLVSQEVKEIIKRFSQSNGQRVDNVKEMFQVAVINSLWRIVASKRFAHDDPKLMEMMADSHKVMQELMNRAVMFFVPWTRHFLPPLDGLNQSRDRFRQFYVDAVDEHKATYKEDDIRDFIDVYLTEMNAQKDNPKSTFYGSRGERQLHAVLGDLFFAGTDTTSATLAWTFLYLCKFKHVQEKLREEITAVTIDSRMVALSDRPNMPYSNGVMEEVMRYSSIIAQGVQHRAMVGKEFKGYFIPEDTWIFPNLFYIHHNPKIWGDPQNFRPERFLSEDGKTFKKNPNLMPFQIGRRQCVGESLARDTFFLFLTNIFQKFCVSFDPSVPEPPMEAEVSFVLCPHPYSLIFNERNINVQ